MTTATGFAPFSAFNGTSSNGEAPRNGGQSDHMRASLSAILPSRPGASSGDRVPGSVRSKARKSPTHLPAESIERILAAQESAGVLTDAQKALRLETSAAARTNQGWVGWLASWFNASPGAEPSVDGESDAEPRMREGILTGKKNMPFLSPNSAKNEKIWVKVLQGFFGADNVHVVDMPPDIWPYLRNVASTTPDGTLITSRITEFQGKGQDLARNALEDHFRKLGLPVLRLRQEDVNFANVEYVASRDTLIVAHSDYFPVRDMGELERAFGNPAHVLVVSVDLSRKRVGERTSCYDLDLSLHVTMNADGEPVALLYEDCLKKTGLGPGVLSPRQLVEVMNDLGFTIVPITEDEQRMLAANSVSNPDRPGELLFTRDGVSPSLVQRLVEVGVTAVEPHSGRWIGYTAADDGIGISAFGLHCLTLNFRIPVEQPTEPEGVVAEPKDAL